MHMNIITISYQKSINAKHYEYSRVLDVVLSMETNLEAYSIRSKTEDGSLLCWCRKVSIVRKQFLPLVVETVGRSNRAF